MFTGLTSQVSSWMGAAGKKDGETQKPEEENLASPVIDSGEANDADQKKETSPTKTGKLEMFSNVKNQMTSWLGSGVPGLRKSDADVNPETQNSTGPGAGKTEVESPASEKSVKGSPVEHAKEDDDSSATGGADSDVAGSEPGTPAEDKEGAQPFGAGTAYSSENW